jgi:hypothetical protein
MLLRKIRGQRSARYRILRERITEPLQLNLASVFVAMVGSFRSKVEWDLVNRNHYAYGLLNAADQALEAGLKSFTAVEFGVAAGEGLINMCSISARLEKATGVRVNIVGFDSGTRMPPPKDYRDHPEEFQAGDFPMNQDKLRSHLPPNCQVIVGPVRETVRDLLKNSVTETSPLGFVAFDLDYYSSTKEAMALLEDTNPAKYLFLPVLYFGDVVLPNYNNWAGELLAINGFNAEHQLIKIEQYRFLRSRRMLKNARWIDQIYLLHLFDHPRLGQHREERSMSNVYLRSG